MKKEIIEQPKDSVKDAILKKNKCTFQQQQFLGPKGCEPLSNEEVVGDVSNIYAAMDEWSRVQAIELLKWLNRNDVGSSVIPDGPNYTDNPERMFDLFLQSQNKQI